jgi:hypothetical protein
MPNCHIAITDQASKSIMLLDAGVTDWNSSDALKWMYKLPVELDRPNDVKLRNHALFGGQWMAVSCVQSAAIVSYPDQEVRWALTTMGNPHSVELLPGGNIAIAAAKGHWLRIYTSSQGPNSTDYAEYPLQSAHGVLWDPQRESLWALGGPLLVELKVIGSADRPELVETRKIELPTQGGHDLSPVIGNPDRLWVTTNSQVYQYVKSTSTFDSEYPNHSQINRSGVKCIGNLPSGQVVSNKPKKGILHGWNTDTVDFVAPDASRTRADVAFYKARIWNPDYQ